MKKTLNFLKKIKGFYYILDKQKKIHQCKIKAGLFQQKKQEIRCSRKCDIFLRIKKAGLQK